MIFCFDLASMRLVAIVGKDKDLVMVTGEGIDSSYFTCLLWKRKWILSRYMHIKALQNCRLHSPSNYHAKH